MTLYASLKLDTLLCSTRHDRRTRSLFATHSSVFSCAREICARGGGAPGLELQLGRRLREQLVERRGARARLPEIVARLRRGCSRQVPSAPKPPESLAHVLGRDVDARLGCVLSGPIRRANVFVWEWKESRDHRLLRQSRSPLGPRESRLSPLLFRILLGQFWATIHMIIRSEPSTSMHSEAYHA